MKKNSTVLSQLPILGLILLVTIASCKKDEDPIVAPIINNPVETFSSLNDYLQTKSPIAETFSVSVEDGITHTTNKGSIITIPANAFITSSGQSVTGTISVKMKEVFSNAEMMFSGIFPISRYYNTVLNSGGEFFIQASQNGNNLRVADSSFIGVNIPANALDNNMKLFFGGPVEEPNLVNWIEVVDSLITSNSDFTFNSADNSYEISLDSLGWINIDAFDNTVSYVNCDINLTGITGLNDSNTTAFAIIKDMNAVWPGWPTHPLWGSFTNNTLTQSHLVDVPLNFLVISVNNDHLYYGLLDVTPQDGTTYSIEMYETTSANLDQVIESLP